LYAEHEPANFGWLIDGQVAGCARPRDVDQLAFLWERGVRAIVTLSEEPLAAEALARHDLPAAQIPIPDFGAPTPTQIGAALGAIERFLASGRPVVVHCAAGRGRTGTILACWLVREGHTAAEAIDVVRSARPGSIETDGQVAAVQEYARRIAVPPDAPRPPLVIVGGASGTGKTTLAERLADALSLPLLHKDLLKEALYDALGSPSIERSRELGVASFMLLYRLAEQILVSGTGLVLESNFRSPYSEPDLRRLIARTRAVFVYCDVAPDLAIRRILERTERGDRHPGHHDRAVLAGIAAPPADHHRAHDLDLGLPVVRVDTTDGYAPRLEEIVAAVRAAVM
jgi:atypical dual specificity phosphatase